MVTLFKPKDDPERNKRESNDGASEQSFDANTQNKKGEDSTIYSSKKSSSFERRACFQLYLIGCFYKRKRTKRYRRMLAESNAKIKEHLDLKRVMEKLEFLKIALGVLLTARQTKIIRHMSLERMKLPLGSSQTGAGEITKLNLS